VQHQRRQREIVDPVDPLGDLDLLSILGVDLDQHLDPQAARLGGQLADELVGLRDHEAAAAGALDRIADRVQSHHPDPGCAERLQYLTQVGAPEPVLEVDVDLLRGEGRP
jgi:hypothetical protein